ncbi:ABC transporter substrate-binding protein [Acidimangrovimonas sediminis]|uniref:ABC transporter substrate-binding protein n=1 Tax=Acidimangrovimonas sediminis TaxID=2056283 RepID=UPI000C8048A8|nr:ABC transporter substrate-binding protein [Acidimangrovimonas sediminis]
MERFWKGLALKGLARTAAAAVFVAAAGAAHAEDKISIGLSTWVGYGPLYIAQDQGFFKDEGLSVDLVKMEDPKTRMPAMIAGRIDMAVTTIDTVLNFYSPKHPLTYLFALDESTGGDGIVADKDIKTIKDLKGKKVAFAEGSVSQFFLGALLHKEGMKLSDVDAVNMTAGDAGAAFVAGRVQAAVTWEPWLTRGKETDHGHLLIDSSKAPGLIVDIATTTDAYAKAHQADIKKLYKAWAKAVAWQKANPEKANAIMAKGVGGWLSKPDVFAETLSGVTYFGADKNASFIGTADKPGAMIGTIEQAVTIGKETGQFDQKVDPAKMVDYSVVN